MCEQESLKHLNINNSIILYMKKSNNNVKWLQNYEGSG